MLPVVVILTAIEDEYQAVRAHLTRATEVIREGTVYEQGEFIVDKPIARVIIRQCGQSNVQAAAETERAVQYFRPDYIFFVGIAGGRKDVKIGDVVFGSKIYYYEVQKLTAQGPKYRPDQASPTYELEEIVKLAQTRGDWTQWIKGRQKRFSARVGAIASGEKLIDDYQSTVAQDIDGHFNDTLAVEMEGFGFGRILMKQGGQARHLYFGVFRGISDLLGEPLVGQTVSKRPAGVKQLASRTAAALAYWTLYKHIDTQKKALPPPPTPSSTPVFLTDETANLLGAAKQVIGRLPEARTLKQELDQHDKVVVVNGVGGIGKTTLARLYVDTYAGEYTNVLWLNAARGVQNAFLSFDLVKQLHLFDHVSTSNPAQLFEQIIDKLKVLSPAYNLLVLDNVDRKIEKYISDKIQLRPNWKVLLTSRISFSGYKQYLLQALSEADCLSLFFNHYTKEAPTPANLSLVSRIIRAVFHHTLTIELLAKATQANRSYTLQTLYTTLMQEGLSDRLNVAIELPAYNRLDRRLKTTISDCLQIAFSIGEVGTSPLKRELLTYLSVLPPVQLAYPVLLQLFAVSPGNETAFQDTLTFLVQRGWLEETIVEGIHYLYMHPVIQLTLRKKLRPTAPKIAGFITALVKLIQTESYQTRSVEELLLYTPFVESVIDHLPANDQSVATLYESYASICRELYGDHQKALAYAQRAYAIRKKYPSADSVDVAAAANGLAIAYRSRNDLTSALALSQEAVTIIEDLANPTPQQLMTLATYYQNQGQILRGLKEPQQAIDQFTKSLALLKQHQLEHPHLVAAVHNNIGLVYNNQLLDFTSALPYYREAVRLAESAADPKRYHYYNNLADSLIDNQQLSEALEYQHRVVEHYEKAPNKERNSHLAIAYKVLSDIYAALGGEANIGAALTYQNKAIFIKQQIDNPVSLAVSLTAMAKLHRADSAHRDLEKAILFQQQANELFSRQANPQLVTGMEVLLDLSIQTKNHPAAWANYTALIEQSTVYQTAEQTQSLVNKWYPKLVGTTT